MSPAAKRRKKNVIIARNGENVFPEELEDLIHAIPFMLESVVYGAKDATGDEEICVLLVPGDLPLDVREGRLGVVVREIGRAHV